MRRVAHFSVKNARTRGSCMHSLYAQQVCHRQHLAHLANAAWTWPQREHPRMPEVTATPISTPALRWGLSDAAQCANHGDRWRAEPPKSGRPSITSSNLLPSTALGAKSRSRKRTLVVTRKQRRPQTRPQFVTHIACTAEFHTQTSSFVEDSIDTLIDVFDTQPFAEGKIMDTREHAHTSNFGRHCRANIQRDCNFTNRHPSFHVDPFDHHTTSTSAIVFEAAIPKSFHHLPRLGVVSSVKDKCPLSLCSNVATTSFHSPIHGAAQDLELYFKGKYVAPRCGAQNHVNLLF